MAKKYKSLTEFALFGDDDEEIDIDTLVATKKKPDKEQAAPQWEDACARCGKTLREHVIINQGHVFQIPNK